MIVVLDTGVAGLFCAPTETREAEAWVMGLVTRGRRIVVPNICDYELRREMLRRHANESLLKLENLRQRFDFDPIRPEALQFAAEFWARLRMDGQSTADDAALDGDCVLAGQAKLYAAELGQEFVVATTNVKHLTRMVAAEFWADVS